MIREPDAVAVPAVSPSLDEKDSLNRSVAASSSGGQFLSLLTEQSGGSDCPIHRDHDYH